MHCRRRPNSSRRSRHTGAAAVPGAIALLIVFTSALFNLVTAHFGQTVLFRLPAAIPLLGGPYTLEALVFGIINGLVLAGFLGAFTVLTMALPTHALICLIPRALYPVAVVISIAVAFVPATLSQFSRFERHSWCAAIVCAACAIGSPCSCRFWSAAWSAPFNSPKP